MKTSIKLFFANLLDGFNGKIINLKNFSLKRKMESIKLFFVNVFDLFLKKIISAKITESKKEIKNVELVELTEQSCNEPVKNLLTPKKVREVLDPSLREIKEKGLKIRMKNFMSIPDMKTFYTNLPCWVDGRADFHVNFPFNDSVSYYSRDCGKNGQGEYWWKPSKSIKKFVETLFATNCVAGISTTSAFEFFITKPGSLTWDDVTDKINEAIASLFPDITNKEI